MRPLLLVALLAASLPTSAADHGCEDPERSACVGGIAHQDGEGSCANGSQTTWFAMGALVHHEGRTVFAGYWHACEDEGESIRVDRGVRATADTELGLVDLFTGARRAEGDTTACGVQVLVLGVEHRDEPHSPMCSLA